MHTSQRSRLRSADRRPVVPNPGSTADDHPAPALHAGPAVDPATRARRGVSGPSRAPTGYPGDEPWTTASSGPSPTPPAHEPAPEPTDVPTHEPAHPVPAPPPVAAAPGGAGDPAPRAVGPGRRRRHGLRAHRRGRAAVGSWQAGEPAEGLAHLRPPLRRRAHRDRAAGQPAVAGGADPKHTLTSARTLRDGLAEAHVVGDVVGLGALLDGLVAQAEQAVGAQRAERDAARVAAVARKEALAAEAETLAAEATQWKQAGDRFKAILDEWRTVRGIDRKTDELLWKRFSKAREAFNRRRGSHFADLDRQRPVPGRARRSWRWRPRSSPTPTTGAPPPPGSATS